MRVPTLVLVALVLLSGCGSGGLFSRGPSPADRPLILISVDGMRHDYLDREDAVTPTFDALVASGVRAERLIPSYPTKTFPNHYTLVTGLHPEQHGIVNNTMRDPGMSDARGDTASFSLGNREAVSDGRWWGGEPIWVTAENAGIRTGTVSWPGSEAEIMGVRPTDWLPYDGDMPYDARVDQALEWIDEGAGFVTLYFEAVDDAGHRYGPLAAQTARAMEAVDGSLERLLRGLRHRRIEADIVIVSDHGMTEMDPSRRVYLDDAIDLDTEAYDVIWGESGGVWPASGADVDGMVAQIDALEHASAWRREDVPARYHYSAHRRIPPIVIAPDEGWTISSRPFADRFPDRPSGGSHGFDNALVSMHGVFVASGPSFKESATVAPLASVDVYGVLAQVLGVTAAENAGDPSAVARVLR